jgi:hypothetical protein
MSSKKSLLLVGFVLLVALLIVGSALAKNLLAAGDPDAVRHVSMAPRHSLDDEFTQVRYVKTTDFGVTWTSIQAAGDLSTFSPTTGILPDFGVIVLSNNELCCAVYLSTAATPGVYSMTGPTFAPVLVMAEGTNNFHGSGRQAGWCDMGKDVSGNLYVVIWGKTATGANTFWGVKSSNNGTTWGTPFVIATEPAISATAEYPHIAELNGANWCLFNFQDQSTATRQQFAGRFPTSGGAGTVQSLNSPSGTDVSYYTGNCQPIAYDPTSTPPAAYIIYRNSTVAAVQIFISVNDGQTWSPQVLTYAQRYPSMSLRMADQVPFITSNKGLPSVGAYHFGWFAFDETGYNGSGFGTPDTLAVCPTAYNGVGPLFYMNMTYWWDADHGVGMNNYWGQFTPEGVYTEYSSDGGDHWSTAARRWDFATDGYDVGTVNNWGLVGGTNGVAYAYSCGMVGTTDLTPPSFSNQTLLTPATTLGPYVVAVDCYENNGISSGDIYVNWIFPPVDGTTYNTANPDSSHLTDPNTGSGTYYFTIPDTHSNGTHIASGDTIWFYCDGTDGYLNYNSHWEQAIVAGSTFLIADMPAPVQPNTFVLYGNYPNPFNPSTTIYFDLPKSSPVTLKVFNTLGEEVATVINGATLREGRHVYTFDGSRLSSGVYFYTLNAGHQTATQKMMLMK